MNVVKDCAQSSLVLSCDSRPSVLQQPSVLVIKKEHIVQNMERLAVIMMAGGLRDRSVCISCEASDEEAYGFNKPLRPCPSLSPIHCKLLSAALIRLFSYTLLPRMSCAHKSTHTHYPKPPHTHTHTLPKTQISTTVLLPSSHSLQRTHPCGILFISF